MLWIKPKTDKSTPFSTFIREASSGAKKRVYSKVLREASKMQNDLVRRKAATNS